MWEGSKEEREGGKKGGNKEEKKTIRIVKEESKLSLFID